MLDLGKLKKIITGNKTCNEEHFKQFTEKLKEEKTKTLVVNDLPKLLPAVCKYAFHENAKLRESAVPAFIELTNLLDLNKHLKEKPWWSEMKGSISKSVDVLMQLVISADKTWSVLWSTTVTLFGTDLRNELTVLNKLLKVVEKAFKMNDEDIRCLGFVCWRKLIDNFAINRQELNNKRRLNLLIIPLKANNHTTKRLCECKMETWKHLLSKLDQHNEMTVQLSIPPFLEFMFAGVSLPPVCQTLNTDCANVLEQLLKTSVLFRILPELFIKYTFVCIEHIYEDLLLSLNLWESLLGNLKNVQWAENSVTELMTGLNNAVLIEKFSKSKTFAHLVHALYSGTHAMEPELLVNYCQTLISIALEPQVLFNFSEAWCSDLFYVVANTDPILLPQNMMGDVIRKLSVLSASELFRDDKLKFLRGIWITVTNILCKWMSENGQIGRNGSLQTDMQNTHLLLMFGAANLSSMWNKFQMKTWKTLYSECVRYFSLLPEANTDKYINDLIHLLLEGVCSKHIPLHVAVDLVCIILEFNMSKDATGILPLMMEIAESAMLSLQQDVSNSPTSLSHYLKSIVAAARSDPALVNDILSVANHMFKLIDTAPLCAREKIQNTILKAQHQLQTLKPTRIQDKSNSPGNTQAPPASSPITSFMHRLAKAKESKAKMGSPTPSQSTDMSSSPVHTPTSKKASSPFADFKSEDFVFVPPKTRKTILTDHQKESLRSRKHDIPALYQDLSQDSSQSAYESIVTSVQTVEEDVDKVRVLQSPKKLNDCLEVALKVSTPKKVLTDSYLKTKNLLDKTEGSLHSNKENDCFNNNTSSPFSSVTKQDDQVIDQDLIQNSLASPLSTKPKLQSKSSRTRKDLSQTLGDNDKSNIGNEDSVSNSTTKKDKKESSIENNVEPVSENENFNESEIHENLTSRLSRDASSSVKRNISDRSDTPKRNLKRNQLIKTVKKSFKKVDRKSSDNSKFDLTPPSIEVKSPNSNVSAKISPRRLRKRKSGITPILSGGKYVKKKNLSLSRSSLSDKETPKSSKPNSPNVISIGKTKNKTPTDVSSKKAESIACINLTSESNLPTDKSEYNENHNTEPKAENKLNASSKAENKSNASENIEKKPMCNVTISPVKVVLSRLPNNTKSKLNLNFDVNLRGLNSNNKEQTCTTDEPVGPVIIDLERSTEKSPVKNLKAVLNLKPEELLAHENKMNKSLTSTKSGVTSVLSEDQFEIKKKQSLPTSPACGEKTPNSKFRTPDLISSNEKAKSKSTTDVNTKNEASLPSVDSLCESSLSTDKPECNEHHSTVVEPENVSNTPEENTEELLQEKDSTCNITCSLAKAMLSRPPNNLQCKKNLNFAVSVGEPGCSHSSKSQTATSETADPEITFLDRSTEKSLVKNLTAVFDSKPEESLAQNNRNKSATDKTKVLFLSKSGDQLQNKQVLSGKVNLTDKIIVSGKSLEEQKEQSHNVQTRSASRGKVLTLTDKISVTNIDDSPSEKLNSESNTSGVNDLESQSILEFQSSLSNSTLLKSVRKLEESNKSSIEATDLKEPAVQESLILNKENSSSTRTTRSMESTKDCSENKLSLPNICANINQSDEKSPLVVHKFEMTNGTLFEEVNDLENPMALANSFVKEQKVPSEESASFSIKIKSLTLSKNMSEIMGQMAPENESDSPKKHGNINKSPAKEQTLHPEKTLYPIDNETFSKCNANVDSAHESKNNNNLVLDISMKDKDATCRIEKNYLVDETRSNILSPTKVKIFPQQSSGKEEFVTSGAKSDMPSVQNSLGESTKKPSLNSTLSKPVVFGNTPMKAGQKQLKQTQLPFTPIQKPTQHDGDSSEKSKSLSKENKNDSKNSKKLFIDTNEKLFQNHIEDNFPLIVLCKLDTSEECISKYRSESSPLLEVDLPRTPEKAIHSQDVIEIGPSEESVIESPQIPESEDIIASSQESVHSSIILTRISAHSSKSPLKMLSKSPKKFDSDSLSQFNSNSDRKAQNLRFSSTPIKKSVCRRLDVEIDDEPVDGCQCVGDDQDISLQNKKKVIPQLTHGDSSEELLNDIKLLNGGTNVGEVEFSDGASVDNFTLNNKLETKSKNVEENQPWSMNTNSSPKNHTTSLKRLLLEPNSNSTESPKNSLSQLRLEGTGSPKSPSSRTNQMMELAMQEKEKTISSPVSSLKKRRIQPLRLGPVLKTPQSKSSMCTTVRTHIGPSEEWVRRTYSPSASPNSSILKRKCDPQPSSPDSSPPPSGKKKRVSFLDPPVSESLLFSKANPGKGQIQRPETKQETESEDLASQGSVQLQVTPSTSGSESNIFHPLKLCQNPVTDILERIVSIQWANELESQLERLGVTTIGQLSSLTETTIERLPFIPPKIERLRKILQNYHNEINENPDSAKQDLQPMDDKEWATLSDEVNNENSESPGVRGMPDLSVEEPCSTESISSIAEHIKSKIEKHPALISELGNKLDVEIIMSILRFAVTKLKDQNDER